MSGALLVCIGWLWLGTSVVSAAGHLVRITGSLDPAAVAVAPGDTITWRNDDSQRHRIRTTSGPGEFDSGDIEPGGSYSVSLTAIGTYAYRDERNRDLAAYWGTVVVSTISSTPSPGATTGTPPTAPPTGATIGMAGRAFGPSSVTIVAGGTVTWRNDDDRQHTATASSGAFDSGVLNPGASYSRTFANPGAFPFLCLIHPDMTGTVNVALAPGATAPPPVPTAAATKAPPPASGDVTIVDFAFNPGDLTIDAGSRVVFANRGVAAHTVTATGGTFDSGLIAPNATYAHTFGTPGTFPFLCALHPAMTGTIRVRGPGGATPPPVEPPAVPTAPPSGVRIVDFAFQPAELRVRLGTTVSWVNGGVAPHTVTSAAGDWDSGNLATGGTYSRTFSAAGAYPYLCTIHPTMTGTVIVESASTDPVPPEATGPVPGSTSASSAAPAGGPDVKPGGPVADRAGPATARASASDPSSILATALALVVIGLALGGWVAVLADLTPRRTEAS